ncbi:MAG TPA: DUF885 domain-containing protein [Thermoanaerobaculia bacterium]|nr:DUF885 domain-containing protein [Thermoanaerobaculia bacterium]
MIRSTRALRGAGRVAGAAILCILGVSGSAPGSAAPAAPAASAAPASPAATAAPAALAAGGTAAAELATIAADYWRHELDDDFYIRMREGLPIERLPDLSPEDAEKEAAWARTLRERLARIDEAALTHGDWLTLALLRHQAEESIAAPQAYWYIFLATPYDAPFGGVHTALGSYKLASPADLASYLRLLHAYAAMVEQLRRHLEGQQARGILMPKPEVDTVAAMLRAYARPPRESVLQVSADRLHGVDAAAAADFHQAAGRIIVEEIDPALVRLADELAGEYRRQAPDRVGIGQYPGGDAAYRSMIRIQTGFDLAPEEIHRRGEAEVERLSRRMADVRHQLGFAGTAREFNQRLRSDPRFLARTPEEVAERLMAPVRKIEPKISAWFLKVPKAPYGVEALPTAMGGMTYGYYQVPTPAQPRGRYLFNPGQLDQRPLVWAAALIYHELIPGHHFQLALQAENPDLPPFRRYLTHTAFVEGWGEYSSHLGEEMGLYDDPYSLYGRLAMDMFLSTRLVVDTGMNALGWTRQQATDYMRDRLLESDVQIDSEVLRYSIAMPAQALAYKLGATHIEDLRRQAETALGPRFDIRRFHEAVLGNGSLPPDILAKHIDWWIEQEKRETSGAVPP